MSESAKFGRNLKCCRVCRFLFVLGVDVKEEPNATKQNRNVNKSTLKKTTKKRQVIYI